MCNNWCYKFGELLDKHASNGIAVLEVGSRNVNGSLRDVLETKVMEYIGVDIEYGPGVDRILDASRLTDFFLTDSFDFVVCTEMLEHCYDWRAALVQMLSVLKQGGILLLTTRSPGFELHDYPADYWRFSRQDFKRIFEPVGEILELEDDMILGWPCGIGIILQKDCDVDAFSIWRHKLNSIEVSAVEIDESDSGKINDEQIIFDQFSRYKACADILTKVDNDKNCSVLDVGSGSECLLGRFLPDAKISYLDPLIQNPNGIDRIAGDITSPLLEGRSFNVVTAVDVLEHVRPDYRHAFLNKLSSLAENALILAFPSSDTTDAEVTDRAVDMSYRDAYGSEYPWLREHRIYGLPSLEETKKYLENSGWSCMTTGHGHAPWLQELLGFIICAWDVPFLRKHVYQISEQFNQELCKYDFVPPFYRSFIIASKSSLPDLGMCSESLNIADGNRRFKELMNEASRAYFFSTLSRMQDDEQRESENICMTQELEILHAKIDAIHLQNKKLEALYKAAIQELDVVKNSRSWRITSSLRFLARGYRYGLLAEDRLKMVNAFRRRYHLLPLPAMVKSKISRVARGFRSKLVCKDQADGMSRLYHTPMERPKSQQDGHWDYVFWGVIDWHFRYQRPQQLATSIAQTGRRCFYISPEFINASQSGFHVELIDSEKQIYQVQLYLKSLQSIYSTEPSFEMVKQLREGIGEFLIWAGCQNTVSLVQHPFWLDVASVIPNGKLVYDCMDHHEGFDSDHYNLQSLETRLLQTADCVVTTSTWLDEVIKPYASNSVLIRNAGDYEHFSTYPVSCYRDPDGKKVIGYYGAIAEWFDIDLVETIARSYSDAALLLIGADTVNSKRRLGKLPNVTFIGEVSYSELPFYLYGFDLCLLPFKVIPLTLATNPVKVYEYLSAGKPVVSVDLPEMQQFKGLVDIASTNDEFLFYVGQLLARQEKQEMINNRKAFASTQTWCHRAASLIDLSESKVNEPLVSIIVVTWNNLQLTRKCLESIMSYSGYENIEVIVVDNASSDGTREYLIEWSKSDLRFSLILNEANRGFAAANNQGLTEAKGDFLVMLNNDTVVTNGWIRTLIGHLRRDSSIGIIGPVTNNIGNEAKIDISYETMPEMARQAELWTRHHIGKLTYLNTIAFFCAAMSRSTWERVGPLDENFGRGFFEDDDYCRRIAQEGLRVACAEDVFVHHHLSASFDKVKYNERQKLFEENRRVYEKKWGEWIPHQYRDPEKNIKS